ncbi:TPA: hypothetical protein ACH3X3_004896 [Trebouxia sp. C0006]
MIIQQTVSPPGLYPPKHYSKATTTTAIAWSPEEQPTSEEFSQVFHKTELKFRPDEIIYTDGSRKEIPGIGLVTGSGVYREHKHAHLSLKVHPYEQGMLKTINRAELVALLIATGREGEHSNRLEVLDAEDWPAPKVTVIDGR